MTDPTDEALLLKTREGDRDAFAVLYNRYKPRLFGYCHHLIADRQIAEDIVQTTFLKAFKALSTLDNPNLFYYWLFSIARNEIFTILRQKRTEGGTLPIDEVDEIGDPDSPHEKFVREETREVVQRCLGQLKVEYRELLVLRQFEKLSYAEIAAITGDTLSAVESRLFKARRALAKKLAPYLEAGENHRGRNI